MKAVDRSQSRLENNHRAYTLQQINELRAMFAEQKPSDALRFLPYRQDREHLQVLAVANFKGGSAKTTTSVHLAQYLALHGYRVLAIDLDPQASLSAMFGFQPEIDVQANETIYAALRYDDERRPMKEIIHQTYFDGIDLIPGNLEVMEYEHETPRILAQRLGSREGDVLRATETRIGRGQGSLRRSDSGHSPFPRLSYAWRHSCLNRDDRNSTPGDAGCVLDEPVPSDDGRPHSGAE